MDMRNGGDMADMTPEELREKVHRAINLAAHETTAGHYRRADAAIRVVLLSKPVIDLIEFAEDIAVQYEMEGSHNPAGLQTLIREIKSLIPQDKQEDAA